MAGVSKSFVVGGATVPALRELNLRVEPGEFVCVVGPSGCGKTTLLRVAAGLLSPDQGVISLTGLPPAAARAAKRVGYVPQDAALLPWRTAVENVSLALEVNPGPKPVHARQTAREMLERVGLGGFEERYPHQLSGGMRQRVTFARALVLSPALLLLDEPFSALDELSREALRDELLADWTRERPAVLFVTHSVAEAVALADRVVVLSPRPGTVVGEVAVDLPRPRFSNSGHRLEFQKAEGHIRALLRRV